VLIDQDAAHTGEAGGHLFRAYMQDPNGHALPLLNMWSLTNETSDSWVAFQELLAQCFEGEIIGEDDKVFDFLNDPSTCFLTDQQKGLLVSQATVFPNAGKAACFKHFQADMVTALGHKHIREFDELAFCTREDEFDALWAAADPALQVYLAKYPRSVWTKLWGNRSKKTRTSSSVRTSHRACVYVCQCVYPSVFMNAVGPLCMLRSSRA